jgi:hypothetical protein
MDRTRLASAAVLGALVALLTASLAPAASAQTDPTAANRGWDNSNSQQILHVDDQP